MPRELGITRFRPDIQELLQDFDCGSEPWEKDCSDWIKGEGAVEETTNPKKRCVAWIYSTEEDGIVGFSSLGETRWPYPDPEQKRQTMMMHTIPWVAVQRPFHGQALNPGECSFFTRICEHLVSEMRRHPECAPQIALYVHPLNINGRNVWERLKFNSYPKYFTEGGIIYLGMIGHIDEVETEIMARVQRQR